MPQGLAPRLDMLRHQQRAQPEEWPDASRDRLLNRDRRDERCQQARVSPRGIRLQRLPVVAAQIAPNPLQREHSAGTCWAHGARASFCLREPAQTRRVGLRAHEQCEGRDHRSANADGRRARSRGRLALNRCKTAYGTLSSYLLGSQRHTVLPRYRNSARAKRSLASCTSRAPCWLLPLFASARAPLPAVA